MYLINFKDNKNWDPSAKKQHFSLTTIQSAIFWYGRTPSTLAATTDVVIDDAVFQL